MKNLPLFTRQLAAMLQGGLTLVVALEHLDAVFPERKLARAAGRAAIGLRQGWGLSECFGQMGNLFPRFFLQLLEIGEKHDSLLPALNLLADHYSQCQALGRRLAQVLFYPLLVLLVAVGSGLFALWYVAPIIAGLYRGLDAEIPAATAAIFSLSRLLTPGRLVAGLLTMILCGILVAIWVRTWPWPRLAKLPLAGSVNSYYFCRVTEMTVEVGNNLEQGLELAAALHPSGPAPLVLLGLRQGLDMTEALVGSPGLLRAFISQGEATGQMGLALGRAADYFQQELELGLANIQRYLEPLAVLLVGCVVASMLLTLMLPLMGLLSSF